MNKEQPLLSFSWRWARVSGARRSGPYYDTLQLFGDGSLWFWSPASQVNTRDHAGTYYLILPGDVLAQARDLAERLAGLPPLNGQQARDAPIVQVFATVGDKAQTHLLSQQTGARVPPEWKEALAVGGALRRRAEDSPLAAVQLSWEPTVQSFVGGQPGHLVLSLKNIGSRSVRLRIDPDSLSFYAKGAEGRVDEHEGQGTRGERRTPGLQDENGALLGGISAPAQIKPGHIARAFFANAYTPPGPGKLELSVSIEGNMTLLYPKGSPLGQSDRPTTPFKVQTGPMSVQVL